MNRRAAARRRDVLGAEGSVLRELPLRDDEHRAVSSRFRSGPATCNLLPPRTILQRISATRQVCRINLVGSVRLSRLPTRVHNASDVVFRAGGRASSVGPHRYHLATAGTSTPSPCCSRRGIIVNVKLPVFIPFWTFESLSRAWPRARSPSLLLPRGGGPLACIARRACRATPARDCRTRSSRSVSCCWRAVLVNDLAGHARISGADGVHSGHVGKSLRLRRAGASSEKTRISDCRRNNVAQIEAAVRTTAPTSPSGPSYAASHERTGYYFTAARVPRSGPAPSASGRPRRLHRRIPRPFPAVLSSCSIFRWRNHFTTC